MLSRPGRPIFVGLGTAAILAMGASPVLAEPEPGAAPDLLVTVTVADTKVEAGTEVPVTVTLRAQNGTVKEARISGVEVKSSRATVKPIVTPPPRCPQFLTAGCDFDTVTSEPESVTAVVSLPKTLKQLTTLDFKVTVKGMSEGNALEGGDSGPTIVYTPIKDDEPDETKPPKPPTSKPPKPSPTPTKPKPKPSPTKTENDDNNSGGGGNGNNSGGNSNSGNNNTPNNNSTYTPPSPNSNPQVALPPIQQAPSPSVAPNVTPTPESRLRNNKAPIAQDLTFERMASTQIAWLAALMVAFSLLMTQLRLGRPRNAAAAARAKGAHRRPKRGTFGK
ncbi:hypothetical protein [Spirillospora sp. CA-294931]|uniref:hypothetical protein n=1 Tax=Spirillospora sp. CA-294931 TaxID=3240042 RepID=UPI003D8B81E3